MASYSRLLILSLSSVLYGCNSDDAFTLSATGTVDPSVPATPTTPTAPELPTDPSMPTEPEFESAIYLNTDNDLRKVMFMSVDMGIPGKSVNTALHSVLSGVFNEGTSAYFVFDKPEFSNNLSNINGYDFWRYTIDLNAGQGEVGYSVINDTGIQLTDISQDTDKQVDVQIAFNEELKAEYHGSGNGEYYSDIFTAEYKQQPASLPLEEVGQVFAGSEKTDPLGVQWLVNQDGSYSITLPFPPGDPCTMQGTLKFNLDNGTYIDVASTASSSCSESEVGMNTDVGGNTMIAATIQIEENNKLNTYFTGNIISHSDVVGKNTNMWGGLLINSEDVN